MIKDIDQMPFFDIKYLNSLYSLLLRV